MHAAAALTLAVGLGLSGCGSVPEKFGGERFLNLVTPYRMEVVQGNVVTREQAAAVKPGMTRAQVRDILGSPMLTDMFHADRWDYVFTIVRQGTAPQRRTLAAYFNGERLERLDAPDLPTEQEFVASITRADSASAALPALELSDAQRRALPAPAAASAVGGATLEPLGAARSYPPLEPM